VRVDVALLAAHDRPGGGHDVLRAQALGERVRVAGRLGMEDELHDPRAVAQVDEDQAAVVAPPVHPAGHAHGLPDARGGQLATPGVAVAVLVRRPHRSPRMRCMTVSGSTVRCSPGSISLSEIPSSPRMATYRAPERSACLSLHLSERPPSSSLAAWPARRASAARRNAAARCDAPA